MKKTSGWKYVVAWLLVPLAVAFVAGVLVIVFVNGLAGDVLP